jgi:hypothetical protein
VLDREWAAAATQKVASRQAKLEADLAESKAGMIKESIRMAHKDIADFFYAIGDLQAGLSSLVLSQPSHSSYFPFQSLLVSALSFVHSRSFVCPSEIVHLSVCLYLQLSGKIF